MGWPSDLDITPYTLWGWPNRGQLGHDVDFVGDLLAKWGLARIMDKGITMDIGRCGHLYRYSFGGRIEIEGMYTQCIRCGGTGGCQSKTRFVVERWLRGER